MGSERDQWRKLDAEATPGPWVVRQLGRHDQAAVIADTGQRSPRVGLPIGQSLASLSSYSKAVTDAEFIAAARTGWPAAEAEVEQQRALLREAREYIADEWSENCTIVHRIDALLGGSDG